MIGFFTSLMRRLLILLLICLLPLQVCTAEKRSEADGGFFPMESGKNLRRFGNRAVGKMLARVKVEGQYFGKNSGSVTAGSYMPGKFNGYSIILKPERLYPGVTMPKSATSGPLWLNYSLRRPC